MSFLPSSISDLSRVHDVRDKKRLKIVFAHIVCWAVYIAYEMLLLYYLAGKLESPILYITSYCINILFFYGQVYVLNTTFRDKPVKFTKALLLFAGLLLTVLVLKLTLGYLLEKPEKSFENYLERFPDFLKTSGARAFYFIMLATFYWAASHISYFSKQANEAEKKRLLALNDKLEAESRLAESRNAYLTQQLNPHLLFNSLNFIYNSVYQQSAEGAACVLLLSDIMRFSLEDTGADGKVGVADELAQVKNLIEINRYRFNQNLWLDVAIRLSAGDHRIIPLVLLTLTENLFKHGNLKKPDQPGLLEISVNEGGQLVYHARNLKKSKSEHAQRRQVGLQNVRIRLDFAYPGNYTLQIAEDDDFYELWLNLQL